MHLSKKLDLELDLARKTNMPQRYVKARILRTAISPFDRFRIKMFNRIMKKQYSLGRVLDIGCNIGEMAKFYHNPAGGSVLCDVDDFMLRGARLNNKCARNLNFCSGNIKNLPFKSESFDTIIALEVIEHVYKKEQGLALAELLRVAKPGAIVYLATPNRFSLAGLEGAAIGLIFRGYKWDAWDNDHKYVYFSWQFINFLESFSNSLKVNKIYGSYFLPGSLTVRLPFWMQRTLGYFSYAIDRTLGDLMPVRYMGFVTLVVLQKKLG